AAVTRRLPPSPLLAPPPPPRSAFFRPAAPEASAPPPRRDVVVPRQQHVRHLLPLRVADLLLHPVGAVVDLHPDPVLAQPGGDLLQVGDVRVGDRDPDRLDRRQPRRGRARVVPDQDPREPLDRAEQRARAPDPPLPRPLPPP